MSDQQVSAEDRLREVLREERRLEAQRRQLVAEMRNEGASWARVGAILGITKQGATKTYAGWVEAYNTTEQFHDTYQVVTVPAVQRDQDGHEYAATTLDDVEHLDVEPVEPEVPEQRQTPAPMTTEEALYADSNLVFSTKRCQQRHHKQCTGILDVETGDMLHSTVMSTSGPCRCHCHEG